MPSEPLLPVRADHDVPLCVPHLAGNEWDYVSSCLDTGWVSSAGEFVETFEAAIARRVGTDYAVATSSGTSALHVALLVAGVQPGDEVVVSTLTFIAPANAIRYVGAHPVFVDAEPEFWQLDSERVRSFLENDCRMVGGDLRNVHTGRRVRALLPVHIVGHPADMDPLLDLAARQNPATRKAWQGGLIEEPAPDTSAAPAQPAAGAAKE